MLMWSDQSDSEKPDILISGPFEVVAECRDDGGSSWVVCFIGRTLTAVRMNGPCLYRFWPVTTGSAPRAA
jgi:hypothetical protein